MEFLTTKARNEDTGITFVFAHGAGAPMDSDFMNDVSELFADQGITVVRFEFPYMQKRRETGKKRPPDRAPKLLACWQEALAQLTSTYSSIFIGGKSMGGRMATMLAADPEVHAQQLPIKGCACFGYPYHAPGKPEKVRNEHFNDVFVPILILQGDRDAFGAKEEVSNYQVFEKVSHHWLNDGNHDLKPRKVSGTTHEANLQEAVKVAAEWMKQMQ
ncbi:alpha/beta family hydrolase [Litoribrevibacter euphylliae]|uniref:Alpha/beta family hydrolase n=1 Tax=Litoribrevibacter euphylliae TaxID=1834034 RepID=A0ABV7HIF9_9GAMM